MSINRSYASFDKNIVALGKQLMSSVRLSTSMCGEWSDILRMSLYRSELVKRERGDTTLNPLSPGKLLKMYKNKLLKNG